MCQITLFFTNYKQEKSEEAEHVSVEMAEIVESLGKLKDEIIKTDLAYRKIENMAKEKKIEGDLVILVSDRRKHNFTFFCCLLRLLSY